jgi:hypothetical protein
MQWNRDFIPTWRDQSRGDQRVQPCLSRALIAPKKVTLPNLLTAIDRLYSFSPPFSSCSRQLTSNYNYNGAHKPTTKGYQFLLPVITMNATPVAENPIPEAWDDMPIEPIIDYISKLSDLDQFPTDDELPAAFVVSTWMLREFQRYRATLAPMTEIPNDADHKMSYALKVMIREFTHQDLNSRDAFMVYMRHMHFLKKQFLENPEHGGPNGPLVHVLYEVDVGGDNLYWLTPSPTVNNAEE